MKPPSGKFVLRVDPALHHRLREEADEHGLSLNEWIIRALTRGRVPPAHPLINELKRIFGGHLLGVIQFGSVVRGEMRESSDIDLLIVLEQSREVDRSLYQTWDREVRDPLLSPQFSHLPKGDNYSSLWLEVAIEGVILYDPTNKLESTLREIRSAVADGRFCRKLSHGHPYWVRRNENAK